MDVEVGYLPKSYYNSDSNTEDYFPFATEGNIRYAFDIGDIYLPECDEDFLPLWMEKLDAYPLYFCINATGWKNDIEEDCKKYNINYNYLANTFRCNVAIIEIKDAKQFKSMLPIFILIGCIGNEVIWSAKKEIFKIEKKAWRKEWNILVEIKNDSSVFCIGPDGNWITTISNNDTFSTYEKICETLPSFVNPTAVEYGEVNE